MEGLKRHAAEDYTPPTARWEVHRNTPVFIVSLEEYTVHSAAIVYTRSMEEAYAGKIDGERYWEAREQDLRDIATAATEAADELAKLEGHK